jgi:hypothetical protein
VGGWVKVWVWGGWGVGEGGHRRAGRAATRRKGAARQGPCPASFRTTATSWQNENRRMAAQLATLRRLYRKCHNATAGPGQGGGASSGPGQLLGGVRSAGAGRTGLRGAAAGGAGAGGAGGPAGAAGAGAGGSGAVLRGAGAGAGKQDTARRLVAVGQPVKGGRGGRESKVEGGDVRGTLRRK